MNAYSCVGYYRGGAALEALHLFKRYEVIKHIDGLIRFQWFSQRICNGWMEDGDDDVEDDCVSIMLRTDWQIVGEIIR